MERPAAANRWMLNKVRLDQLLVELDHYPSRARARDAILRGTVTVDGQVASKPGQTANPAAFTAATSVLKPALVATTGIVSSAGKITESIT